MWILALLCVVAAVVMLLKRRTSDVVEIGSGAAAGATPTAHDLEGVKTLAAAGRTIEAIKLFRELTGADLASAKNAVELIARGSAPAGAAPRADASADERVVALIKVGDMIAAVKLVHEISGGGLKDAKETVERIKARL